VKPRESANPHNRFRKQVVEYDEGDGPPPANITIIEDHARSILSENDSPDVGFRWSANPYRGCQHACSYCVSGDTGILMTDGRVKQLVEIVPGDEVYGTRFDGKYTRYVRTKVRDHWRTVKPAYRIVLGDGTELVASGDHRFLSSRGWKHVIGAEQGPERRPHLTERSLLLGTGKFAAPPTMNAGYRRGYLCGMIRGDGTMGIYGASGNRITSFRLALADGEALARTKQFLELQDVETRDFLFTPATTNRREMRAIRTSRRSHYERIRDVVSWPELVDRDDDWCRGFLAGIFDAEGSHSCHALRISNLDPAILSAIKHALGRFGFDHILEESRIGVPVIRVRGGLREHLRFYHSTGCAITRKWNIEGNAIKNATPMRVVSIEPVGVRELFDITTGTGDFIANGVVSHNCYARPTHEYLDMGAGTDFDTKIVVKKQAPALLRATFDKPSWQGEHVMFSGVTDCYQPIEKELELTRQCLEVCLEYRNPVSVITKSALVERDIELFLALQEQARFHLSVSLAFTDNALSRAIEPWAASPDRRFRVIENMAKAGVHVGVMVAPVIPGVNDSQMVELLERAANAGATEAGWVLLRLPGAVATVFEERMRQTLPLAADKILHRIRGTRGGGDKLYNSQFHTRGRGEGPYAQMLKTMFDSTTARLGMNMRRCEKTGVLASDDEEGGATTFRRPPKPTNQLLLF
jgi:DNA repair photolyase